METPQEETTIEYEEPLFPRLDNKTYPVVMKKNSVRGRILVATRDIDAAEMILVEEPLISGPTDSDNGENFPVCLNCYCRVSTNYKCSNCKWPVCDSRCEKYGFHGDFECRIFKENDVYPFSEQSIIRYEHITVLRLLLLQDVDPLKWKQLRELESHCYERRFKAVTGSKEPYLRTVYFVREMCKLEEKFDENIVHFALGVMNINGIRCNDALSKNHSNFHRYAEFLYRYGSMVSHSCAPNAERCVQEDSLYHLRATVPIKAGEEITVSYIDFSYARTQHRQKVLKDEFYFSCTCSRCKHPAELGTYFSATKCVEPSCAKGRLLEENEGYYLPVNPCSGFIEWKCNNQACGSIKSCNFVINVIKKVQIQRLCVRGPPSLGNVDLLMEAIRKNRGVTLHPTHYLILIMENELYNILKEIIVTIHIGSAANNQLVERLATAQIDVTRRYLEFCDLVYPGFNFIRGLHLYNLQKPKLALIFLRIRKNFWTNDHTNKPILLADFQEVLKIRREVYDILCFQPKGSDAYRLVQYRHTMCDHMTLARDYFGISAVMS